MRFGVGMLNPFNEISDAYRQSSGAGRVFLIPRRVLSTSLIRAMQEERLSNVGILTWLLSPIYFALLLPLLLVGGIWLGINAVASRGSSAAVGVAIVLNILFFFPMVALGIAAGVGVLAALLVFAAETLITTALQLPFSIGIAFAQLGNNRSSSTSYDRYYGRAEVPAAEQSPEVQAIRTFALLSQAFPSLNAQARQETEKLIQDFFPASEQCSAAVQLRTEGSKLCTNLATGAITSKEFHEQRSVWMNKVTAFFAPETATADELALDDNTAAVVPSV